MTSPLFHPHDIAKRIAIASEDGGMAWDKTYYLILTKSGNVVVRVIKDYSQDYKTPDVSEVEENEYATISVDGVTLADLVSSNREKLLS